MFFLLLFFDKLEVPGAFWGAVLQDIYSGIPLLNVNTGLVTQCYVAINNHTQRVCDDYLPFL